MAVEAEIDLALDEDVAEQRALAVHVIIARLKRAADHAVHRPVKDDAAALVRRALLRRGEGTERGEQQQAEEQCKRSFHNRTIRKPPAAWSAV